MIFKNYYKILGLENNIKSTQEEIKSAYRTQAKKYHPDVNVNNKNAEERFKDINEAYKVLSDLTQKKKYDRSWYYYIGKKIQKEKMSKKEVKVNDIVNMFFGGGVSNDVKKEKKLEQIKGENIEAQIEIQIKEAFEGTHKKLSFNVLDSKNKIINIDIPAGVKNGKVMRIPKQGKEGKNGGENGDVLVKIKIVDNNIYKLVNNDILVNLYVTPWDAALGAKLAVNGIDGELSILIPKGTRVLIVEDIVTTGGSVMEVLDVVKEHGGIPVGIGLLVDRSGGKVDFGIRTEALLHLDVPTFKEEDCPLCKEGKPFTKRGRTGK